MVEDNGMAGWDDYADKSGSQKGQQSGDGDGASLFLKLKPRTAPYRFRLASSPEKFRKHWQAFAAMKKYPISPAYEKKDKDLDVAWSKGNWFPTRKFASLVLDREDGRLKVLEGGSTVFDEFYNYSQLANINPAGPLGPDWIVQVKVTGKDKKGRDMIGYVCIADPSGAKPFTDEEKALIDGFTYNWRGLFKKSSPEEIKALWESLPADKRVCPDDRPKKGATSAAAPASVSAPAAPAVTSAAPASVREPPASDFATGEGGEEDENEKDPLF